MIKIVPIARAHYRQFVKFALVGGSGVVVNLIVFNLTLRTWGAAHGHPHRGVEYLANALGFVVSVMTNYYLNRRWTFRSKGRMAIEFPRFVAVSVSAYLLNLAIFTLFRSEFGLRPNLSQLLAIGFVMPFNYIINKLWSFK